MAAPGSHGDWGPVSPAGLVVQGAFHATTIGESGRTVDSSGRLFPSGAPMQILARIPELQADDDSGGWYIAMPKVSGAQDVDGPTERTVLPVPAGSSVAVTTSATAFVDDEPEAVSGPNPAAGVIGSAVLAEPGRRARSAWLPTPSILVLSMLAVAIWGAALRNDRLRLEAARQARAERLAQVLPDAVSPRGSRTR